MGQPEGLRLKSRRSNPSICLHIELGRQPVRVASAFVSVALAYTSGGGDNYINSLISFETILSFFSKHRSRTTILLFFCLFRSHLL